MPELPEEKKKKGLQKEYFLEDPEIFIKDPALGDYFEKLFPKLIVGSKKLVAIKTKRKSLESVLII